MDKIYLDSKVSEIRKFFQRLLIDLIEEIVSCYDFSMIFMNTFSDLIFDWKQLKTDIQEASFENPPLTTYFLKISALVKKPDVESEKKLDKMRN